MKNILLALCLILPACRTQSPLPDTPGVLFIRQQICDLADFKTRFFTRANHLPDRGFQAYRIYRDPQNPQFYLLVFTCGDLGKAAGFIPSSNFSLACVGAGLGAGDLWAGLPEAGSPPDNVTGREGLALAMIQAEEEGAWKHRDGQGAWRSETWYRLPARPRKVLVARAVVDMNRARDLMEPRDTPGAARSEVWFGTFLEGGTLNP
jgi:hypothetical protein